MENRSKLLLYAVLRKEKKISISNPFNQKSFTYAGEF